MNSKKVIVFILFIVTLILGAITLYLAYILTNKPKPIVTPTPTVFLTPTQAITRTPSPTPTQKASVQCGELCTNTICQSGSSCITVNSEKKCVSDQCINKSTSPFTLNNLCDVDLCTLKSDLTITKETAFSCVSGGTKIVAKIVLINKGQTALDGVKLVENLDAAFDTKYLTENKISNTGKLSGKQIEWENLNISANNGKIELTYEAIVPSTENDKSYTSSISALQNTRLIESANHTMKIEIIPCTDLEGYQLVYILIGSSLIFLGIVFIKKNYDEKLGQILWNLGLEGIYLDTLSKIKRNKNFKFESLIIKQKTK